MAVQSAPAAGRTSRNTFSSMVMLLSCPCSDESVCGVERRYATAAVVAVAPKGRGFGRPQCFLYLFGELYVIIGLRFIPPILLGREVDSMVHLLAILESVAANVMSHYICKWLDRFDKDRKPD